MAGVSALLKSAQSTQKKVRAQEEAEVAYNYSQSAKTYQDFAEYSKYLTEHASATDDPSDRLTYTKKVDTARRSYVSNEIQRQTINVIEGRSTNTDKYGSMVNLFYQAVDNGDYDLAQSLNLQLDNLSVKIQNEQEAKQRVYGAMAATQTKTFDKLISSLQNGAEGVVLPDGTAVKPINLLNQEFKQNGDGESGDYFYQLGRTAQATRQLVIDQYQAATTQDQVDKLEEKYGQGLSNLDEVLKFKTAAGNLSALDVEFAWRSAAANNPIYSIQAKTNEQTGETEYALNKNKIDDYVFVRGDDGSYSAIETRSQTEQPNQSLSTRITDSGQIIGPDKNGKGVVGDGTTVNSDSTMSIQNRLNSIGIRADTGENGQIKVYINGTPFDATIQPDGTVRYFDNGELKEISTYARNIGNDASPMIQGPGDIRTVSADEVSDFSQEGAFGGLISSTSAQGRNYMKNYQEVDPLNQLKPVNLENSRLAGLSKPLPNAPISLAQDFSGRGAPATSALLQSANFTNLQAKAAQERAIMLQAQQDSANRLQSSTIANLNQTPVQQLADNGVLKKQLQVKPLAPAPKIYVAPPTPAPATKVVQADAGGQLGFTGTPSGPLRVR